MTYARILKHLRKQIQYRGVEQLEARRAHNPEVVGSSPASATIKTPDFDKKSGVFLTFWGKMKDHKKPVGLAVGLAPFWAKLDEVKNPTF